VPKPALTTSLVLVLFFLTSCASSQPTGTIALSSTRDGNPELCIINADSTGLERLTYGPSYDSNPVFSPDSQHIAFNSVVDGNVDVYVMHKDGSPAINLTNGPGDDGSATRFPDGTRI
jgi:TolB protein